MSLVFASICPHPPIIIPTIGGPDDLKKVPRTIAALKSLNQRLKEADLDTVIIVSPHGRLLNDNFSINTSPNLLGNFSLFGDTSEQFYFNNDLALGSAIIQKCQVENIPLKTSDEKFLDHGALIPLYYLGQKNKFNLITISYCFKDIKSHFQFGKAIQDVIQKADYETGTIIKKRTNKRIGFIASGDMSHRLNPDAPAGYSPKGKIFDDIIINLLKNNEADKILNINPTLADEAGECGFRSIAILLGILDGLNWKPDILAYENPFGVGYLTVNFVSK